ncbi:hypothetical protein [Variovorax sp. PAMC 28711]|uniref:hypothetical protein n=1 Tax=Variovorax sp. PAMC 28711 TaxID=1795631 RepID=UPI00078C1FAF|nr:hypothetical protein [Variovorax sp. PAMC 28711]AMM22977.1 hypothetical protein AX767_00230 [Variovorax sp. PAMC 28711]
MPEAEYFTFTLPRDPWRKKPGPSPFKMTREEAQHRYPGAVAIESTREVRQIGDGEPFQGGQPYGQ